MKPSSPIPPPPAYPEDVRLMYLVAQGDARARNLVAMRLCTRVGRIARGLLGAGADAEDAAQDALIEILRSAGSYRGMSTVERWADRIAVRTGLRNRRRRPPATSQTAESLPSAEAPWASDALPRPLQAYLDEVPDTERRVLFLKHALGYTVPEIAELTQTAKSTVKFRLANALQRVRKSIRRDCNLGARSADAS